MHRKISERKGRHGRPAAHNPKLVFLALIDWLRQKLNFGNRVLERGEPNHVRSQMRDHHAIGRNAAVSGMKPDRGQSDMSDAVVVPHGWSSVEEKHRGIGAGDARQAPFNARDCLGKDWRLFANLSGFS
jgi:hypothetical protein